MVTGSDEEQPMDSDCPQLSGAGQRVSADVESRQRIAEDHHALGELLDRLEATSDPNLLALELAELERLLTAHFALEEGDDGLHEMVGDAAPHMLAGVQRLFDEHRRMSARLAEIRGEVQACLDGPVARLVAASRELAQQLRRHEQAENELVAGALYDDLGISS